MLKTYKDITKDIIEHPDVCIIGSGAGGAVVADILCSAGVDVVMLEEGGYYTKDKYKEFNPVDSFKYLYRDYGATITYGNVNIIMPLGKAVGGTTVVNSATCFRTPDYVLEDWKTTYNVINASPKEMETYFQRVEKRIDVHEVTSDILGKNGLIFKKGADALGLSNGFLRHNIVGCKGHGRCTMGCPIDAKKGVHLNFIPSALKAGLRLYSDTRAEQLILKGKKIVEIKGKIINPNNRKEFFSISVKPKLLVLSAGAVYTPYLLKKNNINLSSHLGKHLTIHPAARVLGLFDELVEGYKGVPQGNYVDEWSEEGIMLEGIFTPPEIGLPIVSPIGYEGKELAMLFNNVSAFGVMVSDKYSSGKVLRGIDGMPIILYNFKDADKEKMIKGIAETARIYFAAGAKKVYLPIHGIESLESIDDIKKLYTHKIKANDIDMMAFHPLGTARMGEIPKHSVVNSFGKVHALENLFISDGSIFPSSLGVNPQITIMAFSMRNAEYIVNNKKRLLI